AFIRAQEPAEKSITQFPSRGLDADVVRCRSRRNLGTLAQEIQFMLARQIRHKLLVRIRFSSAQPVIEMCDGENNPKIAAQLEQQPQKCNGINPARNGNADPVPGAQQFLPPDMGEHALGKSMHANMVQRAARTPAPAH
ncbi:MAG: hypothetical protein WB510_08220, partial [Candidatus Sulfotelmatobacter sp.]